VRLLIDESLSGRVARLLSDAGHDAIHVGDIHMLGAPDVDVMAAAWDHVRTIVSIDTDFGELLALGRHPGPSVILLRRAPRRPDEQAELLLAALDQVEEDIDAGAVVVLSRGRARVRRLPIEPAGPPHPEPDPKDVDEVGE